MAEKTILVCDACGDVASRRITIRLGQRSLVKDLCDPHLAELTDGARLAKRGRPKTVAATPSKDKSASAAPTRQRRRGERTPKRERSAA